MKLANITTVFRSKLIIDAYSKWFNPGENVLDIGCGTGVVAKRLTQKLKINIVGCDIEKYLIVNLPFKKIVEKSKLPFGDKEFEKAMFNDVLHHTTYDNQINLIKEALRVSDEVLIFELIPTLSGKLFDYLLNKIHNPNMNIPYTYRGTDAWEKLFKKIDTKHVSKIVEQPKFYPFSHVAFKVAKK